MNQHYNSASCFACGLENASGLRLRFYDNGKDQVFAYFTLEPTHAGYPGMAHGGIIAAVLDEVGGRTLMINNPYRFFVTAHMDVRYRHPVPVGVPLQAAGWLLKRRARRTRAHTEIYSDGKGPWPRQTFYTPICRLACSIPAKPRPNLGGSCIPDCIPQETIS
jgi:acyl-coenzyme A thioesterase PaaI-like protein